MRRLAPLSRRLRKCDRSVVRRRTLVRDVAVDWCASWRSARSSRASNVDGVHQRRLFRLQLGFPIVPHTWGAGKIEGATAARALSSASATVRGDVAAHSHADDARAFHRTCLRQPPFGISTITPPGARVTAPAGFRSAAPSLWHQGQSQRARSQRIVADSTCLAAGLFTTNLRRPRRCSSRSSTSRARAASRERLS